MALCVPQQVRGSVVRTFRRLAFNSLRMPPAVLRQTLRDNQVVGQRHSHYGGRTERLRERPWLTRDPAYSGSSLNLILSQLPSRMRQALRSFRGITGLTAVASVASSLPGEGMPLVLDSPIHPHCRIRLQGVAHPNSPATRVAVRRTPWARSGAPGVSRDRVTPTKLAADQQGGQYGEGFA